MSTPNRNDPCPCGSGKKYKKCCLKQGEAFNLIKQAETASISKIMQEAIEHHQAGRLSLAEAIYQRVLQVDPDSSDALHLLGVVALQMERNNIAVELIGKAIRVDPFVPQYYSNLGMALQAQGRHEEAVEQYRKALSINSEFVDARYNMGNALQKLGQLDDAKESYGHVLELNPEHVDAHNNLGNLLLAQGKLDAAIEHYHKALTLKPDNFCAYSNLLYLHAYQCTLDPSEYLSLARGWEQACVPVQARQLAHERVFQRPPLAGRRLKVGYVSGDYRQHAVSYFIEQLFAHHDKTKIELFAYSINGIRDAVTERLQALAEHWISVVGMNDTTVLDQIEADGIDVLIDLSGHTAHNRLGIFARRAAPVQAHYLGYFASTGLTEMDHWIGDGVLTPVEMDHHFSEQVWRLPRVWVSYDGKADAPVPNWQPSQDGTVWLGSFNNLGKLTPATLALWGKVLQALPEGKLLLKTKELADASNCERILETMSGHDVLPDRIELQGSNATPGWQQHMAYYDRMDIALDPVGGVGGGTTTCDALWMGVPVIALEGDRMASRMTDSMLNAVGHPEWIAHSETEYIGKVIDLARDMEQRKALRPRQRNRMAASPLCDARGLAMALENAYFDMFERRLGEKN